MRYVLRISCVLQGTLDAVASGTITIALKLYSLPEVGCCDFLCVRTGWAQLGPQHACRFEHDGVRTPSPRHGLARGAHGRVVVNAHIVKALLNSGAQSFPTGH